MIHLFLALAFQQPGTTPQRGVSDPGVIATGQRISPAGVQSVFVGRVGGVRFGRSSDEIWVAVPDNVFRMQWQSNRVLARASLQGRPGVYGVTFDSTSNAAYVSFVGRTPSIATAGQTRPRPMAVLHIFRGDAVDDTARSRTNSGALGDFMAGAPALAARADSNGQRLAAVPLPANDELAVLDADDAEPLQFIGV